MARNTKHPQIEDRAPRRGLLGLSSTIVILGIVSLLTDLSTEMLIPIVPIFLQNVIGASATNIGIIEGFAESVASLLRVVAGSIADYFGRPKLLTVIGYGLSSLSKPFYVITAAWSDVFAIRIADRFGKGIRSAPRDVIITESAAPEIRGKAFGLHRAMDTTGAVLGPLAALLILRYFITGHSASQREPYTAIFLAAAIPAILAVIILAAFVPEKRREERPTTRPSIKWSALSPELKRFLLIVAIFSIGNSSDAFLIIRSKEILTVSVSPIRAIEIILFVYILFNAIAAALSLPAGVISDKVGRKPVVLAGLLVFSVTYLGFALAKTPIAVWILFAIYGIYAGLSEGVLRAFAADLAPRELRGTVIGAYFTIQGAALLPASIIAGILMDHVSHSAPFVYGAIMSGFAALLLIAMFPRYGTTQQLQKI
jgi:MFS family permease